MASDVKDSNLVLKSDLDTIIKSIVNLQAEAAECRSMLIETAAYLEADRASIDLLLENFKKMLEVLQNHDKVIMLLTAALKELNLKINLLDTSAPTGQVN